MSCSLITGAHLKVVTHAHFPPLLLSSADFPDTQMALLLNSFLRALSLVPFHAQAVTAALIHLQAKLGKGLIPRDA